MNKIILTNIFLLFSYLSNAQTVTWSKYFDPSVDGELMNYLVKSDSGYLLGTDIFCTGSSWNGCLYLAKLDNLGNVTNSEYFNKSEELAAIGIELLHPAGSYFISVQFEDGTWITQKLIIK